MAERTVTVRLRALTSGLTGPLKQAGAEVKRTGRTVEDFSRRNEKAMNMAGKAMLAFGAGTAYGLKQAVDASISFESAFAGVRKTVSASPAELAKLSAGIRQLAKDIPVTVEEIAGIGEAAGQLGVSTKNIMGFTKVMADLGVATNMSSEEAATSLARLANITDMPEESFDRLGSTVVALGNNLATTEGEIVEMGLRLAGAGAQVGMAESEILGLAGALSSVGIRAEAGGSAISKVMIEIASQVENGGEQLETFARVAGMSAEAFSTAYREDATDALITFIEGLGNMEAQGGSTLGVLEELEITEVRMRDALLRTSGAGDQLRKAIELGNGAWEENNALTVEAAQRYGTTESQLKMASNRINDMKIALGDALAPTLLSTANAAAGFAETISDLSPGMQNVIAKGGLAASGIGLVGGAALLALPRIVATKDALAKLNVTAASTAHFGMAAGAAIAAGKAYSELADGFREGRDAAQDVADEILSTATTTEEASQRMSGALGQHIAEARRSVFEWETIRRGFSFETIGDAVSDAAQAFGLWRTEVDDSARASAQWTSGLGDFAQRMREAGGTTDNLRAMADDAGVSVGELRERAAEAGVDIDEMAGNTEKAESAFTSLEAPIEAAFAPLGAGIDPIRIYTDHLR